MKQQMVTITKEEYLQLKEQAEIDTEFVKELIQSFENIQAGKIKRVR